MGSMCYKHFQLSQNLGLKALGVHVTAPGMVKLWDQKTLSCLRQDSGKLS